MTSPLFTIDQAKIEHLLLQGLREELSSAMRTQWGTGQKLRNMVDATIGAHEKEIERQVKKAVLAAIQSDAFIALAQQTMLGAMKDKFAGAFEAVMRAAGKRAAQDALIVKSVAERVAGEGA